MLACLAVVPTASGQVPPNLTQSDNVRVVATFDYSGGTDIDFAGDYIYAGEWSDGGGGGVHIIDFSGKTPTEAALLECPGSQNDVAVVSPGLLALGYHSGTCGGGDRSGVRLVDVSDAKSPKLLDDVTLPHGTHTLTVYPGKPIIYASGGGGGVERILDASNPNDLRVVSVYNPATGSCHDVTFHFSKGRKLAFCAGGSGTEIWDVRDPLSPKEIATIDSPFIDYHHSAAVTSDGKYVAVGDESFTTPECVTGQGPIGGIYLFDISNVREPVEVGHVGPRRGLLPTGVLILCTAHNFNFVPGTRVLVSAWYTGGTSVIDFEDPSEPREIAFYSPLEANAWSSYWHNDHIYVNGGDGLQVLKVKGLRERP